MSSSRNRISKSKYLKNIIKTENSVRKVLLKKYSSKNPSTLKYQYTGLIMENLIFNKNSHLVTVFKDFMIWDYLDEFFKRFYFKNESFQRVPKFSTFYKNYLKFFCIPTLKDPFSNEIIHSCSEKKAELFYNENYQRKKKDNSELKDCGLYQDSESESESKNEINSSRKIFFNETARKKIEKISPINTSMVLNESETKLKDDESGLLITVSEVDSLNENSLRDIIVQMKKKNKINLNSQKLTLYASDYTSSKSINKAKDKTSRNKSLDIVLNNNNNNRNNQLTSYNKPKEKEREKKDFVNQNKNKREGQIKTNNFIINVNNSNHINKRNNSKIITSLNNNNNNYNRSRNLSQNPQMTSSLNNNTYSRNNHMDKINNIKKTINLNVVKNKNNNIQAFLGKYNVHNTMYINQPPTEKKAKNINKTVNTKENLANSAKSIFAKNNFNNNMKMTSYKFFMKNTSISNVKLPKANNNKSSKKTARILSYKDFQKSETESMKKNRNKNIVNTKLSFDGILHNNMNNNNKKYNIINYNGDKHIHNINININNHINIGPKQFQDIFTFSDLVKIQNKNLANNAIKKNNIYSFLKPNNKNNYISRNKNETLDINSLVNNTNNNKISSATDIHNSLNKNSIYKTQYLINKGKAGNVYNFKSKKSNRIKMNNENIFRGIKSNN